MTSQRDISISIICGSKDRPVDDVTLCKQWLETLSDYDIADLANDIIKIGMLEHKREIKNNKWVYSIIVIFWMLIGSWNVLHPSILCLVASII